jgi:hypothetical protein
MAINSGDKQCQRKLDRFRGTQARFGEIMRAWADVGAAGAVS